MVWIRNTSKLDELLVSASLLDEVRSNPRLEVLGQPAPVAFDADLNMIAPHAG